MWIQQNNISDPDKAEALAKAFLELMRINLTLGAMDANYPETDEEEDRYDKFVKDLKAAEEELFYRFKDATGRQMYRLGPDLFVDGVNV